MLNFLDSESLNHFNEWIHKIKPMLDDIDNLRTKTKILQSKIDSASGCFGGCAALVIALALTIATFSNFPPTNFFMFIGILFIEPFVIFTLLGQLFGKASGITDTNEQLLELNTIINNERQKLTENKRKFYLEAFNVSINNDNTIEYLDGNIAINNLLKENRISQPYIFYIFIEANRLSLVHYCIDEVKTIGKFIIPFDSIFAYTRIGDFYTKTNITGAGSNYKKGLIGALVAGEAGAIISSRNEVVSNTTVIDKRNTILELRTSDSVEDLIFTSSAYETFIKLLPSKELSLVNSKTLNAEAEKIQNSVDTKECPFCAETIKIKAKICRFCNRELPIE